MKLLALGGRGNHAPVCLNVVPRSSTHCFHLFGGGPERFRLVLAYFRVVSVVSVRICVGACHEQAVPPPLQRERPKPPATAAATEGRPPQMKIDMFGPGSKLSS